MKQRTKTLILHIGLHKTGTSSIQATLAANRDLLYGRGLLFPAFLPANHSLFFYNAFSERAENYHANLRLGCSKDDIRKTADQQLAKLQKAIADFKGPTILLSGEDACTLRPQEVLSVRRKLDQLAQGLIYRILLYTRHPVEFASSAIQENVKGNGMTVEDSKALRITNTVGKIGKIYDAWADAFGDEAIEFRSFETTRSADGGLIGSFFSTLGIPVDGLQIHHANSGNCDEVTKFLSSLYQTSPGQKQGRKTSIRLTDKDRQVLFALKGSKGRLLTPEEQMQVWENARSDLQFLEDRFSISYRAPAPDGTGQTHMFSEDFFQQLATALPSLSVNTRKALLDFLLQRHSHS